MNNVFYKFLKKINQWEEEEKIDWEELAMILKNTKTMIDYDLISLRELNVLLENDTFDRVILLTIFNQFTKNNLYIDIEEIRLLNENEDYWEQVIYLENIRKVLRPIITKYTRNLDFIYPENQEKVKKMWKEVK